MNCWKDHVSFIMNGMGETHGNVIVDNIVISMDKIDFDTLIDVQMIPIKADSIIFSDRVREYCKLKYPRHPQGCPNYNKNPLCPPRSKKRDDILKKYNEFHLAIAKFDFLKYIELMKKNHPDWNEIQLRNLLYWQKSVKKHLREFILRSNIRFIEVLGCGSGFMGSQSLESAGVNVFIMLQRNGITFDLKGRKEIKLVALLCNHKYKNLNDFMK